MLSTLWKGREAIVGAQVHRRNAGTENARWVWWQGLLRLFGGVLIFYVFDFFHETVVQNVFSHRIVVENIFFPKTVSSARSLSRRWNAGIRSIPIASCRWLSRVARAARAAANHSSTISKKLPPHILVFSVFSFAKHMVLDDLQFVFIIYLDADILV